MERWPQYNELLNAASEVPPADARYFVTRGLTGKPLPAYPMSYQNQYGTTMVRMTDMQDPTAWYNPVLSAETFYPPINWLPAKYILRK